MERQARRSRDFRSGLLATLRGHGADLGALVFLTAVAAVPRLVFLQDIPAGFHGDEAWTGLDAQRVLEHGWIGPYVVSAVGQPAGPLYFAAPFVAVFGHTIFAVRFAMAVLGIATIPAAYLAFRIMFSRSLAFLSALFLAISVWHLHYSRIGLMVISWPLMEMIALFFLFLGIRTGRRLWYALAGGALGLGVYTYNAYPVFLVPIGLFLLWMIVQRRGPERLPFVHRVAVLLAFAAGAALPLIGYALDPDNNYLAHHRTISIFETAEWSTSGTLDRADILLDQTGNYLDAAFWSGGDDFTDGAGARAMVDPVSLGLIIIGLAICARRWREPSSLLVVLMVLLLPFGTITNAGVGKYRQTLGIVPVLAVLMATPLVLWWQLANDLGRKLRMASYIAIALIVAAIGFYNFDYYFAEFPDTVAARYTFAYELADASRFIHDLPGDPYVYFYSGRWGYGYETRRFLASNRKGEDRSIEFTGSHSFSLTPSHPGSLIYLFLDPYLRQADEVARLYPGGQSFQKLGFNHAIEYRAYYLPRGASGSGQPGPGPQPAPGATAHPTPTHVSTPGEEGRDAQRVKDLAAIKRALEQYQQKHGAYPSNDGGTQTLCTYSSLDAGCALREFLSPLPSDPLGDPLQNGYFYVSNGHIYGVYAIRESGLFSRCPQHPAYLVRFASVLCATGP